MTRFILDTGAFDNVLAVRAGRQVTKVKSRLGNPFAYTGRELDDETGLYH